MSEMISAVTRHLSHACSQEAPAVTWLLAAVMAKAKPRIQASPRGLVHWGRYVKALLKNRAGVHLESFVSLANVSVVKGTF